MITQVDIFTLKNKPVSRADREQGEQLNGRESEEYSIFFKVVAEVEGKEYIGLGEARPSSISSETLSRATRYGKKLARGLAGKSLPILAGEQGYAHQVHGVVQQVVSEIFGYTEEGNTQQRPSPSVCFAAECALLDIIAKHHGVSVAQLVSGNSERAVVRNVFNDRLKNTEKLLADIADGKAVEGWLRRGRRIGADKASALVNSLLFALKDKQHSLEGIILNAGQRWQLEEWKRFCDEISLSGLTEKMGVEVVVEDPFAEISDAFYREAFAYAKGKRIRIMLAKPVWGVASVRTLAPYMANVDLKITPQKAGGFHEVLETERVAKELGFDGGVFLGNLQNTSNFTTLTILALAKSLSNCRYFPATFKREKKVRLVHPRAERNGTQLVAPEGSGWATNVCRSALKRRLMFHRAYGVEGRRPEREARKSLLRSVFDDRFLSRESVESQRFKYSDETLAKALQGAN
ncbi:hypothetical protein [Halomonas stenophila]|uniref:L-alanine-DL-glutamate epimerase-like enolase superfamily enzyme n=1 Tax=Halomonas stenophila TaxID=795312 RepID=A0A7W5ERL7_9GAMM|nr:hypothetical protein [Halomonas stenophila]MBB3230163.1 L-alanine-DL-glutamate epimerase-like enolase superfamily enzyme [Halomonas stenophila]